MKKKITYDNLTEDSLQDFYDELYEFIEKRCERTDSGSLPVQIMIRANKFHYPFNDTFLMSSDDNKIDQAIEYAVINMGVAMDRLKTLWKIRALIAREKK